MQYRNIILDIETPLDELYTIKAVPDLTSAGGELVLQAEYAAQTKKSAPGTLAVPVKASGTIAYTFYIPKWNGNGIQTVSRQRANIAAGADISLSELLALSAPATSTVEDILTEMLADYVAKIGNETIAGTKTFTSPPVLATPLKLVDPAYVPFAGSLNSDVIFSVGSNDNVQNNAGVIETANHFVGVAHDLKITASGADKWYFGTLTSFRIGGGYTGSNGYIYGHYNSLTNRGNLVANPKQVVAGYDSLNLESPAQEAVGRMSSVFRGSAVACPRLIGFRGTAQNGYANADYLLGVEGFVTTGSAGAVIALVQALNGRVKIIAGHTATTVHGLSADGWEVDGEIQNSVGLYIPSTIDVGTISQKAIQSESTAPSEFAGPVRVPSDAYDATWQNNFETATKGDLYPVLQTIPQGINKEVSSIFDFTYMPSGLDALGWVSFVAQTQMFGFVPLTDMGAFNGLGVMSLNLRTNATNAMHLTYGRHPTVAAENNGFHLGGGAKETEARFAITVPSDGTNNYTLRFGFQSHNNTNPNNGVFFRYNHAAGGGNYEAVCRDGGVETAVDTGIAPSASMSRLKVVVNDDGSEADFYIDDALVATINTNIPAATNKLLGACWSTVRSAGVAEVNFGWIDYVRVKLLLSTPR